MQYKQKTRTAVLRIAQLWINNQGPQNYTCPAVDINNFLVKQNLGKWHFDLLSAVSVQSSLVSPKDSDRLERSSSLHQSQTVYWFFQ